MRPRPAVLFIFFCIASVSASNDCPNIISRNAWGAKQARQVDYMIVPVHYVIIQHTAGNICTSRSACAEAVAGIQAYHMDSLKWDDIGFSFLVGGDGNVYEGRGWHKVGGHTRGYNTKSVGIALIGDFTDQLPPRAQLEAVKKLLDCGVKTGRLSEDFKLLGHRQVSATKSPGLELYQEIQTWPQWSEIP